jgi:nucleotide-binding universal stress UspA family protein
MLVVYATDGSAGSKAVGAFLARLALAPDDAVLLLGVAPLVEGDPERLFAPARAALAGTRARVETEVRSGSPSEQILDCAKERGADLIAVGATGLTGLARFFIGSVAERVLRHAARPVLVARPVRHGLRRTLVGVDRSVMAARVADTAARFPLPPETEIRLVTVLPPQESVMGAAPLVWASLSNELQEILRTAREEAEDRLRGLSEVFQEPGKRVSAELLRGDPATALIGAAESGTADLVVLGSHGEGGMDRFLLGSVSERVARHAPCSVLVVR